MEIELLNLPLASRTRLQARLRGCKSELERLKQAVVSPIEISWCIVHVRGMSPRSPIKRQLLTHSAIPSHRNAHSRHDPPPTGTSCWVDSTQVWIWTQHPWTSEPA